MTGADSGGPGAAPGRLSLRSFRTKFILVAGAAVLFDLLLSGGMALYNVHRLSRDAVAEVGAGLGRANEEFLRTYIETTAARADLLLAEVRSQLETLTAATQFMLDNPATSARVGDALLADPTLSAPLHYNAAANWAQSAEGAPSAVSVWGYLLGPDGTPKPSAQAAIRDSAVLELLGPALMATGPPKLQFYYIGPRDASITRSVPYSDQAGTLDRIYPGHNAGPSFWDFFFPGIHEGWQGWLADPSTRPTDTDIVATMPYLDSTSGSVVVSYFDALYTPDRKAVAGGIAVDLTLDQLVNLVENVDIASTGFGFLATSNGNVLATSAQGARTLELSASDVGGEGVTGIMRSLRASGQAAIAALELPQGRETVLRHVLLEQGGEGVPYLVVLRQLAPNNLWNGESIAAETMTLGFAVSERDINRALISAQANISAATRGIIEYQILIAFMSLAVVLAAVYAVSGRVTAGLSQLAEAARRLQARDYSVRVDIPSHDEVGAVGTAFNRMAEEIRSHTANLEGLVAERTRELEKANVAITALNTRLASENTRLGAELDVARRIQTMVLPREAELAAVPRLDIAGYMAPADEVGGDYYDVLRVGDRVKVGIGDVTGHGLESGVLMLMVQSVARALHEQGKDDPREFLEVLNRAIWRNIERTGADKHLSLAFLDYAPGRLILSGQHEEVLVARAGGEVERIDTIDLGFPVGLEPEIGPFIGMRDIPVAGGDVVILHTDGVTEAEGAGGELFGIGRLIESTRRHRHGSADEIKAAIIDDLTAFIDGRTIHDDITLVILKFR